MGRSQSAEKWERGLSGSKTLVPHRRRSDPLCKLTCNRVRVKVWLGSTFPLLCRTCYPSNATVRDTLHGDFDFRFSKRSESEVHVSGLFFFALPHPGIQVKSEFNQQGNCRILLNSPTSLHISYYYTINCQKARSTIFPLLSCFESCYIYVAWYWNRYRSAFGSQK